MLRHTLALSEMTLPKELLENEFLNLKVLKGEWGFEGVLMSDWDATYDGVAAANNGLDLEMPSPRFMNAQTLLAAVKNGAVKEATIDDKVLRLFRVALRYNWLDRPQFDPADSTYSVAARPTALKGRSGEHHAAEERGPHAASRSGEAENDRHHRSQRLAGGDGGRRIVGGAGV